MLRPKFLIALLLATLSGCANRNEEPVIAPLSEQEITPEEFAREMGLPSEDGAPFKKGYGFSTKIPQDRVVQPADFENFNVTVDIFRLNAINPPLGTFLDDYTAALVPLPGKLSPEERTAKAKKRFEILANREFAIVSLNGVNLRAYLISGGIEQNVDVVVRGPDGLPVIDPVTGLPVTRRSRKTTPPGNYRLDPIAYDRRLTKADGTKVKVPVAFPWLRSATYGNSQMFWGLWIKEGYFIHSTPHYGELGRPASMGCVRQSFPDAQELYKLLVEEGLSGMIRIHAVGSDEAVSRVRELTATSEKDMGWLLDQLWKNYRAIQDQIEYYGTSELEIVGHSWLDENRSPLPIAWPTCGELEGNPIDCFETWSIPKPASVLE